MPGDLRIRPATVDDWETVVEFNYLLAAESEDKILCRETLSRGVKAALADAAKARYFLATRQERPVGQVMLTYEWSDWRNGHIWWIQSVYVVPECRQQGIYRALHQHVAALAQHEGNVVGLRLYVERNNHRAQQVYQRLGMRSAGYLVYENFW